ncbi:Mannan polymerase complex subunit mnn9 [Candida viswanathii]|uniref:Mannan polymerase complex subunit mnn9 n=1 Tax=Candida viswanathii TaxID=5486 RepID=A0A367YJA8_9ASCO|nr:Mannan polymerase complex subunit mnn9 [Candida viswanathii]
MLFTELKRKKHVFLPLLIVLSIVGFFLYTSSLAVTIRSTASSAFPNIPAQQPQQQAAQAGSQQRPLPKFEKLTFTDYDFDYTKVTYTSTNPKFTQGRKLHQDTQAVTYFPGKQTVLIMSVIGNSAPYGRDRDFGHFIKSIMTIAENQPDYIISLALLCNGDEEFSKIQKFFMDEAENNIEFLLTVFESITLISAPFLDKNAGFERHERHRDSIQRLRRRLIAKSRNFLMLHSLQVQQYVLTIDSDMVWFNEPERFIARFVNSGKDIVVPRVERPGLGDYDKNSWRGRRTKPSQEQLDKMDRNEWETWNYVPHDVKGEIYHFLTYLDNKDGEYEQHKDDPDYVVPLDSVGGAVLFMKSIVIKQGVIFPTSLIVGTTWDRSEGYDGIETEGVCYLAKPLGFSCWGMPNVVAHHTG